MISNNINHNPAPDNTSKIRADRAVQASGSSKPITAVDSQEPRDSASISGTAGSAGQLSFVDKTGDKNHPDKVDMFYINGVFTQQDKAIDAAREVAKIAGRPVSLLYNPAEGGKDIRQAVGNRVFDRNTTFSRQVSNNFYNSLIRDNKEVKIVAHSHGTAIAADALGLVEERLRREGKNQQEVRNIMSKVTVVAIGAFATRNDYPTGIKFTRIVNPNDPIANTSFVSLGGRVEDVRYRSDEARRDMQRADADSSREFRNLLGGDLRAGGRIITNAIPRYIGAAIRKDAADTEFAVRATLRTTGRVINAVSGAVIGVGVANEDTKRAYGMQELPLAGSGGMSAPVYVPQEYILRHHPEQLEKLREANRRENINITNVQNNGSEFLARAHAVNSQAFNQGYLKDHAHRAEIQQALLQ